MTVKFLKVTKTSPRNKGTEGPYWREAVIINASSIESIRPCNSAQAGQIIDPDDEARSIIILKGKDPEVFRVKETVGEIAGLLEETP